MKKFFLLSLAVASVASVASAADYQPGTTQIFKNGYTLEHVWGAVPDGIAYPAIRTGIGVNNKFYLMDHGKGTVKVYDEFGLKKDIKIQDKIWVSCTVDEAGNVIARTDKPGWAGPEGAGWYLSDDARLTVISSETDEIVKDYIDIPGAPKSRFDALGPIRGNILTEPFTALYAPSNGAGNRFVEFAFSEGACIAATSTIIEFNAEFSDTAAKGTQTLGSGQCYDVDKLAMLGNPHLNVTGWDSQPKALGNAIQLYDYVVTDESESWKAKDEFVVCPQHAPIGGFFIFELAGNKYIVYPAGTGTIPAGDAFAIAEFTTANTPLSNPEVDKDCLVARKYAAATEEGAFVYPAKGYWYGFNVVPVENEDAVLIYTYCAGCPMSVYKFSVDTTGVNNVLVKDEAAPVEYYNLQGIRVANPENGVYIRRQGDKSAKVVL